MRSMRQAVDPLTGIVTGVKMLPREPGAPAIYNATVRMADTASYLGAPCVQRNGGAGLTEEEAVSAALGEGVERYCAAVMRPDEMVTGSIAELKGRGRDPLCPDEVALFAASQRGGLPFAFFDEATRLSWVEGTSLVRKRARYVPGCLVHIPYRPIAECEETIGPSISTGLACARDRDRAILAGLYEAIERDAFAIAWRNRIAAPRLVFDDPALSDIFDHHFARPGLVYYPFLLQFDIAVPTVMVIVEDRNFDPPVFCLGGAARMSVTQAAVKALIECAQGWSWARQERLQHGLRERPASFDEITEFDARVSLYACAGMSDALEFLLAGDRRVSLAGVSASADQGAETVGRIVEEIARTGSDVVVIDLTTVDATDLGLHVVKTLCPLLEQVEGDHRFQLLGGSRWRDVPVTTAWRTEPLAVEDINPFPHPYP